MANADLTQHYVSPVTPVCDVIELLNQLGTKLVLVTTFSDELLGTVTDGDIRRALLSHISLDAPIQLIMNDQPKVLAANGTLTAAKRLMTEFGLTGIPKLDERGKVLDILGIQTKKPVRDNAVFLMAGGFGTRLRPLTDTCPKPMLHVGDKPILETILEQFIDAGFYRFYISTHYLNEQIEAYFGDGSRFGVSIEYINEKTPLGTAGAIGLLPESAKQKPLLMMNGDLLTQVKFDELLEYHHREQADVSVAVREYQTQVPYGVIQHDGPSITEIVEKPTQNYFINAGIYCISPNAMKDVSGFSVLDMPTLIEGRLANRKKVAMFPIHEYWLDIGRLSDFEQAQSDIRRLSGAA